MARPLYSTQLLSHWFPGPADLTIGPVPIGTVWDIRNIDCVNSVVVGRQGRSVPGFYFVELDTLVDIFSRDPIIDSWQYRWEGRHILEAGKSFVVQAVAGGLSVSVTGFVLSVP